MLYMQHIVHRIAARTFVKARTTVITIAWELIAQVCFRVTAVPCACAGTIERVSFSRVLYTEQNRCVCHSLHICVLLIMFNKECLDYLYMWLATTEEPFLF